MRLTYSLIVIAHQATIVHLREKVKCLEFDVKKLSADREREERMKEQVKVLTEQLLEAKRHHTPVRDCSLSTHTDVVNILSLTD